MSAVTARCELCVEPPCPRYDGPARLCHAGCCPVGCHAVLRGLVRRVLGSLGGSNSGCCHRCGKRQFGQPAITHCDKIVFLMEIKRRRPQVAYPAAQNDQFAELNKLSVRQKWPLISHSYSFLQKNGKVGARSLIQWFKAVCDGSWEAGVEALRRHAFLTRGRHVNPCRHHIRPCRHSSCRALRVDKFSP